MKNLLAIAVLCAASLSAFADEEIIRIGGSNDSLRLLGIYKDVATGCEYIVAYQAGITPRIDAEGIHMGCKGLQEVDHAAP